MCSMGVALRGKRKKFIKVRVSEVESQAIEWWRVGSGEGKDLSTLIRERLFLDSLVAAYVDRKEKGQGHEVD